MSQRQGDRPDAGGTASGAPAPVRDELAHLHRLRTWLLENPEMPGASELEVAREIIRLQDELKETRLPEDRSAIQQQLGHLTAVLEQVQRGKPKESVDPDSPYFAHLAVQEGRRHQEIFLGKATRLAPGVRIVDWRNAPISRLFYRYEEGEEYAEEIGDQVREGRVIVRRTLMIRGGELLRVGSRAGTWVRGDQGWTAVDTGAVKLAGGQGAALRAGRSEDARLGGGRLRADKHLPDIAALIDPEQFGLITAPESGVVVLRGSAGSGKTTVALHRVAWLCFEHARRFAPKRVLVVVWGRALRDYVATVLPALGVEGVRVVTWAAWSRALVLRNLPMLPANVADDTPAPVARIKLHTRIGELLSEHIAARPGPNTVAMALEDWATLITDRQRLGALIDEDLSEAALERAITWTTAQTTAVLAWAEGSRDVDARLDVEDDALLLRALQLRVGPLGEQPGQRIKLAHLVLDEVQDFSPVEVSVLLGCCAKPISATLAGDTQQHIAGAAGFTRWTDFLERIGVAASAASTLQVSYRSTHPITRFALHVLGPLAEADEVPRTTRDGPAVELFRFSDHGAVVDFLGLSLKQFLQQEPLANVAILTPDAALSELYFDGLRASEVPRLRRVVDQAFAFAPGVDIVEVGEVKGLEFDYVVVIEASARRWPDTDHHRRLLYVAATRAVHQLWLTTVETPSSLLPMAESEAP